jgi:transposase-like protein
MQQKAMTLIEWQEAFSTQKKCLAHLAELRWPEGFICPHCSHTEAWFTPGHDLYDCKQCRQRTSVTAGTLFHSTKLPLTKWFTALYFVGVDKGGISAERLRLYIDVSWNTANLMLTKLRLAMGQREGQYLLSGTIELDEAFVGGKTTGGKRGRGSENKTAILVACEQKSQRAGYLKMQVVNHVNEAETKAFCQQAIEPAQHLKTDGSPTLKTLSSEHTVSSQVTPPKETAKWLPWVHIAIANLKRFLLGTYHGVSGEKLQRYLNEFCYRFNRRFWLLQIPDRLLATALQFKPILRLAL